MIIGIRALFGLGHLPPQPNLEAEALGRWPLSPQVLLFVIAVVPAHPRWHGGGRFGRRETGRSGLPGVGHRAAGSAGRLIISLVLVLVLVLCWWVGMGRGRALLIGAACGPVEPLFAVICAWLVGVSTLLLPWGLAMAAGAMLFAVAHEMIPESHRNDFEVEASICLVLGLCLMRVLDTALA